MSILQVETSSTIQEMSIFTWSFLQSGTEEVKLKKGEKIKLTLDDKYKDNCDEKILWLDYKNITKVVEQGCKVYVDDGLISLKVVEIGQFQQVAQFKPNHNQIKVDKKIFFFKWPYLDFTFTSQRFGHTYS